MQLQRVTALALCGPYSCRGDRRAVHVGRVPVQGAEEEGVVQERMRDYTAESTESVLEVYCGRTVVGRVHVTVAVC
jgi:hypothetical protein